MLSSCLLANSKSTSFIFQPSSRENRSQVGEWEVEGDPEDPLVLVSRTVGCLLPLINAHQLCYQTEDAFVSDIPLSPFPHFFLLLLFTQTFELNCLSGTEYTVVNLINIVLMLMDFIISCGRKMLSEHANIELQVMISAGERVWHSGRKLVGAG